MPTRPSIKSSVYQPTQARDHSHNESRPTITSPASIMRRRIRHDPAPRQAEKAQRPGQRKRYRQEDDGKDHAPQVLGRNGAVVEVPVGRGSQLGRGQVGHGFSLCPLSSLFEVVVWRGEKLACWLFGLISLSVVLVGTQVGRIRLYCVWRTASKEENSSVSAGIGRALTQHAREKMGEANDTNWLRVCGVNSWWVGWWDAVGADRRFPFSKGVWAWTVEFEQTKTDKTKKKKTVINAAVSRRSRRLE